jgi:hypothetical protein
MNIVPKVQKELNTVYISILTRESKRRLPFFISSKGIHVPLDEIADVVITNVGG